MEEFGCVVHCGCEFNSSAIEPTLMRVEQGLGGVDEAASLRAKIDDLQGRLDRDTSELAWERECNRRAAEEIAEARYWARRLYHTEDPKVPEWVTWLDGKAT